MVVLTVIGSPGATALGVAATDDVTVTLCTRRSGRTTRSAIARVLLPSLASLISPGGAPVMSARTMRKYEPAVRVFGSVKDVAAAAAERAYGDVVAELHVAPVEHGIGGQVQPQHGGRRRAGGRRLVLDRGRERHGQAGSDGLRCGGHRRRGGHALYEQIGAHHAE